MKEYDIIVVGSGCGLSLAYKALNENLKVALVAREHLGGTCMNVGCVPSKTLLYAADTVMQIKDAGKVGVHAEVKSIDFPTIMERMRGVIRRDVLYLRNDLRTYENLDFFEAEGEFIDPYTMRIGEDTIRGQKIFIASGARPLVPPIAGLAALPYLTNESLLRLEKLPKSIVIIGGSYIGVEYAHFFAALGTAVSLVEYNDRLVAFEEPEISDLLRKSMEERIRVYTGSEAREVKRNGDGFAVAVRDRKSGEEKVIAGEEILVAAGRKSNTDRLKVERTGVELTKGGFIVVNDYLETNMSNIWALGDATGKGMFTHAADHEVKVAWHNAWHGEKKKMDWEAVPHAVFTMPQIASIGLTEAEAAKSYEIRVGKASYADTVQSDIRTVSEGFAKAIVEKTTDRILGFHIIGPEAPILIQEVVNVVARRENYRSITDAMHIFPALSELVPEALDSLSD